jgi:hypothetical protein
VETATWIVIGIALVVNVVTLTMTAARIRRGR